ncbi:hypothetical protein [Cellulomonas taurus]|uniref:hypothetical protein n=1 Tax=Cellulomonas taurus TaxID=2729175 RepID=UPI00145D3140|nr:hypothetical protein [Cellulomonas taurus]
MSRSLSSRSRALLALPAAASVLVLLAACSSGSDTTSTGSDTATSNSQPAGGDRMPGVGGVSGEIAEVSDTLMQVQGDDGQTAVSWDASTTISQTVSAALSDVTVGVCVSAVLDDDDLATSITISEPVDGECTGGVGMGGGGGMPQGGELPDGAPTGMPEGEAPADMPTDAPDGGGSGGGFRQVTSGLVTAVDGSTLTVDAVSMGRPGDDSADASTESTVVTVADTTTYTATAAADATAITVGRCVVAQGDQDDSGQMTATSLTLSDATDGGCSTGFGGRPQGGDDSDA